MKLICASCKSVLQRSSKFCPYCGTPTRAHVKDLEKKARHDMASSRRLVISMAIVFGGTLFSIVLCAFVDQSSWHWVPATLFPYLLFVTFGLLSLLPSKEISLRKSFAYNVEADHLAVSFFVGIGLYLFNMAYCWIFLSLFGDESPEGAVEAGLIPLIVQVALLPALIEEWLCRSLLWNTCRTVCSIKSTIVATSLLFAMLHIPAAGGLLFVPNRFATGLVLGWLRGRSGSLVPCMMAHFVNNILIVFLHT